MGLEAVCTCWVDELAAEAKVLLEAREMILRAPFRRTIGIADMTGVHAAGDELRFHAGQSAIILELGAETAAKWAARIAAPPPTLGKKLGIGHASPAFVIGKIEERVLADMLDGHTAEPGAAKISLAVVRDDSELGRAVTLHEAAMGRAPIWVVYAKGPGAVFGETAVRTYMRALGYRDSKVSAVSATLSASRYARG